MTSDEERREVAKRLRRELDYMRERRAWYRSNVDAVECGNTAYRNIAASAIPYGNIGSDYIGVVEHLADLIDRPTTTRHGKFRTKYGRKTPCCEVCGYSIGDRRWGYCPKCGAVIADD